MSEDLGRAVRRLRQQRGETIEALAFKAGWHPTYLGRVELGQQSPSFAKMLELADGLGVPVSTILREAEYDS